MKYISLDTEFVWRSTYYAKLGLIQAAFSSESKLLTPCGRAVFPASPCFDSADCVLLADPLEESRFKMELAKILSNPEIVKIFHDHTTDVMILSRWTGVQPSNIFDTRIAAGFCGQKSTLSLRQILKDNLGFELAKTETRTDWLKRPLSDSQLKYAADDVAHLNSLRERLTNLAESFGNAEWMRQEMSSLSNNSENKTVSPENAWKKCRINYTGIKSPDEYARFHGLCEWRESTAIREDLPRNWIMPDKTIAQLVFSSIQKSELRKIQGIRHKDIGAVAKIIASPTIKSKPIPIIRIFSAKTAAEAERLLTEIGKKAAERKIDPALVASKADALQWCENRDDPNCRLNAGWRKNFTN